MAARKNRDTMSSDGNVPPESNPEDNQTNPDCGAGYDTCPDSLVSFPKDSREQDSEGKGLQSMACLCGTLPCLLITWQPRLSSHHGGKAESL